MALSADQKQESLTASDVVVIDTAGAVKRTAIDSPPSWATETEPSPQEVQLRDQFIRMFHPGRPVLTEIVAASEDDRRRRQTTVDPGAQIARGPVALDAHAVAGGRCGHAAERSGRDSLLHGARSRRGQPRVTSNSRRNSAMIPPRSSRKCWSAIPPMRRPTPKIFERLVAAARARTESVGVRELALDTLKQLTGRDDLGYDPDHPDGKGLERLERATTARQTSLFVCSHKAK